MNLKSRPVPSPKSKHAKKPIFTEMQASSIRKLETNSLDRVKKGQKIQTTRFYSVQRKPGAVINRQNQQNMPIMRNKENLHNQCPNYSQQIRCCNHSERRAINYTQGKSKTFYCFQCSLYLARKGYKISPIFSPNKQNNYQITQRQIEINDYIQKSQTIQKNLNSIISNRKNKLIQLKQIYQNVVKAEQQSLRQILNRLFENHKQKINKVAELYCHKKQQIQVQVKRFKQKYNHIVTNKVDILKNYRDCLVQFSSQQFKSVMSKYWIQVKEISQFVSSQKNILMENEQLSSIFSKISNGAGNQHKSVEFTFSKSHRFDSPESNIKIEGAKLINSTVNESISEQRSKFQQLFRLNPIQQTDV